MKINKRMFYVMMQLNYDVMRHFATLLATLCFPPYEQNSFYQVKMDLCSTNDRKQLI